MSKMKYIIIFSIVLIILAIFLFIGKSKRLPKEGEILPADEMQMKYGLYAENRPEIKIDPDKVPENLRSLIFMAEKWGIGDDVIRSDFEDKASEAEKQEFRAKLTGRTKEVTEWLDSFKDGWEMSEEAGHFMYMLEALDEMGLWPDR